jgi:O-acetyl-ADP-ribose deacetylase (regulator of RNase III)
MSNKNKIEILKSDITKVTVDVIVNAANTSLLGGGGVDGAIHRAGGKAILDDCRKIIARQGGCKVSEAVITTAGNLNARFVIHTVGPVWNGGQKNEQQKLADCYSNSLQLAIDNGCRSIAFPCISTGIYKYPTSEAARVAVDSVLKFLSNTEKIDKVIFVCFDDENFHFIKGQLNYKVYTVPSTLFADTEILGTINLGLADDGMGILAGQLYPTENYHKYQDTLRKTLKSDGEDNLVRINQLTKEYKFKVITDDGTEFKEPVGGLIIYDYEDDPIEVEVAGVDNKLWGKYFL